MIWLCIIANIIIQILHIKFNKQMKHLSTLQKRVALLFGLFLCFAVYGQAQYKVTGGPVGGSCGEIYYEITTTGSDCGQHGIIEVKLTGSAVEGVGSEPPTFTDVKYRCYITGTDASEVEFSNSKIMDNLAPGTYTVEIQGKCAEAANSIVPKMLSVSVDVDQIGAWRPLDMEARIVANPLGCMPNGVIDLYNITGGLPTYKVEIVSAPAGYTPKVLHSGNSLPTGNTLTVNDLIAGTYKVVFSEGSSCKEEVALTFTLGGMGDALPEFNSIFSAGVYPSQHIYNDPEIDHCTAVAIRRNTGFSSDDALMFKYYVENWQNYFEYHIYYKGDNISDLSSLTWTSFPSTNTFRIENLRNSVSAIKIEAQSKLYPYPDGTTVEPLDLMPRLLVRVKGCSVAKEYDLFRTGKPYQGSALSYKDCGEAFLKTGMYPDYDGLFCWPYTWQVVKTKDADNQPIADEVIQTGTRDWGDAITTVGPLAPGYYEYRVTDSGNPAFSWVANTYTVTNTSPAKLSSSTGKYWACEEEYYPVLYFNSPYPATIAAFEKIEYVKTERSTDAGTTWADDASFPAPPLPVIDMAQVPQSEIDSYSYCISLWATSLENVPIPNIGYSTSASYYPTVIARSKAVNIGTELAMYRHVFNVTDTCGVTVEKMVYSPSSYIRHAVEPNFDIERGCLGGIKISVPNIGDILQNYHRRETGGTYGSKAYVWVKEKPAGAAVTYNNTNNYSYLTGANQWIETDKPGKYVIGVTNTSTYVSSAYAEYGCVEYYEINIEKEPTFELDKANTAMYRCPDDTPGRGHVEISVKNGMGPFRFELMDEHRTVLASNTTGIFPNGSWSSTVASDKYIIKAYDEGCLPTKVVTFEQGIQVVDLGNDNTAWIMDPNVCEGDSIVLQALALGKTDYNWSFIDENGNELATYQGRRVVIKDATLALSGRYVSAVSIPGCSGAIVKDTVHVSVGEKLMYWKTDAEDDNWFNTNNWLKVVNGSLESVKTVPAPCSTVHIPGNAKNYPNLSKWDVSFGQAACDTIVYHYGSETAYPNYLSYNRAIVQYNMGYYDRRAGMETQPTLNKDSKYPGNGAKSVLAMERARWFMISTPLKQMVGGDFGLAGYPKMYQRLFNTTRPEAGKPMADGFTKTFNNYVVTTESTGNALALWIPDYANYTGSNDQTYLNNLEGVIEIPYIYNKGTIADNRPLHKYEVVGSDSISTFYYFNEKLEPILDQFDTMKRGYQSYRFVFENDNDEKTNENVGGEYVTLYRTPLLASYDGTGRIMVGNPFMSSISFDKLYDLNKAIIKNNYQIVTKNGEILSYVVGSPLNDPELASIPPLQSFIIERVNPAASEELSFHLNGTKSVIAAASAVNTVLPKPRSTSEVREDFIKITSVAKGATEGGGDFNSTTGVLFNYFEQTNVNKSILNEGLANRADVFFTGGDNYLYSQMAFNGAVKPAVIKSGLISQFTGNIEFTINYTGKLIKSVDFVDTYLSKTEKNIQDGWKYSFNHNVKTENGMSGLDSKRFEFHVEYYPEESTGIIDYERGNVEITYLDKMLTVQSASEIATVKVLSLTGVSVLNEVVADKHTYRNVLSVAAGAYIVQVTLENGEVETAKIIVQ